MDHSSPPPTASESARGSAVTNVVDAHFREQMSVQLYGKRARNEDYYAYVCINGDYYLSIMEKTQ